MRIDNKDQHTVYKDFWDWLFNYKEHVVYVLVLIIGYYLYITNTSEV
jgi:hypothetical protein